MVPIEREKLFQLRLDVSMSDFLLKVEYDFNYEFAIYGLSINGLIGADLISEQNC